MFRFAIPAAAALGLFAAAAQSGAGAPPVAAPDGMGWHLSHEGTMAKLAYGVANSDQLALMLTCEPGRGAAAVYGEVQPATPRLIHASAASAIDPLGGGLFEEARVSLNDPTLQRLARTGSLAVEGDAGRFRLTATTEERRDIAAFFDWCGGNRV